MLPATKLGNIDKDLGDFAPAIRTRDLDRSAQEHENEVNFPICKIELDLDNIASASMGATITATSEYSTYVDNYVIDGDKTHKDNHYWQSDNLTDANGDFASPEYVEINFGQTRKINRIKIYSYPKNTLTDSQEDGLRKFTIEYNTEASGGTWYAWTGLKDVGGGEGICDIASGVVDNNTKHFNIFQDDDELSCRRIRLKIEKTQSVSDRARLCEIEVYRTIQLNDESESEIAITDLETGNIARMGQNRIQMVEVDRRKDWEFHRFKGARLNLSLLNYDKKLSPDYDPTNDEVTNKGYFNNDIRPELPIRVWLGFDMLGYQEFVPAGEFYIKTWNADPMAKIVRIVAKDKVLWMKDKLVEIGSSILENKYVEYLIEWISLRCNISADEMNLDDTVQEIFYFFPQNKMSWETCQDLTEALGDAGLFFNEYDRLKYECYMEQIPHEWMQTTKADFDAGTPTNIDTATESGTFRVTKTAEQLDQSQTSYTTDFGTFSGEYPWYRDLGQSFKLSTDCFLTYIKVRIKRVGTYDATVSLSIYTDDNNKPGSRIAYASMPFNSLSTSYTWKSFTYSNLKLYANTRYWMVLVCHVIGSSTYVIWGAVTPSNYADGVFATRYHGQSWGLQSSYDGQFQIYEQHYQNGDLLSQQLNCGITPIGWGKLQVSQILNGQTITWKTTASSNGSDWDAEVEVNGSFMIQSALKQYLKVHPYLTTDKHQTPIGYSFLVNYHTGGGTLPPIEVSFNFHYDGTLLGIKQTLSSEAGGKCQLYKKAIVKANPYYKHAYEKVWEGDVPFTINDGDEMIYYCELDNPCAPDAIGSDQMKLWVNGAYRDIDGDGTDISIGNLTITITRHPTIAFVKFEASGGNVTITSFWIDAKPFKQTGIIQAVAEASQLNQERYRGKDFQYENNYLYVKAIAEIIANTIIETHEKPKPKVPQDVPVRYCPQIQIMDRVNIKELNSGINQDYQIFGYKHKLVASKNSFNAQTFIQAKEL